MRDYTMECLGAEQARLDAIESRCPVCDVCKCHMTGVDYLYEIDGDLICDDCIISYVKQNFRHKVSEYMKGER